MPVDYDDVESDNTDCEKKVIEGESSVDLDYKSNIKLAKDILNKTVKKEKMLPEKSEEELEDLMAKITLTENEKSEKSSEKPDDPDEIISRAPVGGIAVSYVDNYLGNKANKNGPAYDATYNNYCNTYDFDTKPKRSFAESEYHAVKYKKPLEDSLLQMQCSTIPEFMSQNFIINTNQPSGGIVTVNPSPASTDDYDSRFSPGESIYDSPPPIRVVSPISDYSSMASPDNLDPSFIEVNLDLDLVKKEGYPDDSVFDDIKLNDINEIVNSNRIKEEKERLEKVLSEDSFLAYSPPQHVPGQGSTPSSSPPSLYSAEFNGILRDLLNTEHAVNAQQNQTPNQQLVFSQQQVFNQQQQPATTTFTQSQQPFLVNSNQRQFTQPQAPLVTSPNHMQYNLQPQQANIVSNTPPTQQHYPPQQIITATANQTQYVVQKPQVNNNSQQPVLSPGLIGYPQQNQLSSAPTVSNQPYLTQSNNQFPVSLQTIASSQPHYVQPQDIQITTLPQHQNIASPKQRYTVSPPQQHVTTSLQAPLPSISQLTSVVQTSPSNPTVVTPNTTVLPVTTAPDQNGIATPATAASPKNAVIILTQTPNSQNPIMLVPTTSSQVLYIPQMPVTTKNKAIRPAPRTILPKPPPSGNSVDLTKLPTQTGKGRNDKDKPSQQSEFQGQCKLGKARRCVAGLKDEHLENISDEGDNYLHVAVCKTDVYMIEALLERIARSGKIELINRQNHARQTPVYLAVSANQPAMVHKLIRYGADVNIKGVMQGYQNERVERAPIHCAASKGKEYYDTLKELFKSETIDPDILNSDGLSALHCAIIEHGKVLPNQNLGMIRVDTCQNVALLLKNKANPNLPDRRHGKTPLMYALESKDYAMVETILKGVDSTKIPELFSAKTFDGRTCVKIADGLRNEYDPQTWRKLQNFFSNAH